MKKIILAFALTILVLPLAAAAQYGVTTVSCNPVNKYNYEQCCNIASEPANSMACRAYQNGYSTTTTTPPATTTDAPTGPSQCSGEIYSFNYSYCCKTYYSQNKIKCDKYDLVHSAPGGVTTNPVNTTTDTTQGTAIAGTPQSGSAELASCSSIKFLSIIDILVWVKCIIVIAVIPIIFALALVFFLWGVMKFIMASDTKNKEESKKFIMAGLIGLFVMTSVWGIIKILSTTLGIDTTTVPLLQTTYLKPTQ